MKKLFLPTFTLSFFLLVSGEFGYACSFDTDCKPGSQCIKSNGNIYGYCMGGLLPGNDNDRQPASNPLDLTGKQGSTCSFDVECGPGGRCAKGNSIFGTCI